MPRPMDDVLSRLIDRYGLGHGFHNLAGRQREFLLCSQIKDNSDSCAQRTVKIYGINRESGVTFLDMIDSYAYVFHKNGPGGMGDYAIARIPVFQRALGLTSAPKCLGGQRYLFQLSDYSGVRVVFATLKDRV